jgi:crossover junction endodeoxyribonuclease RuvC
MAADGTLILGIDPGSVITGYGLVRKFGNQVVYESCGLIKPGKGLAFADRLHFIYTGMCDVIGKYRPQEVAIEDVFVAKNPRSALKLGHARGVLMLAGTHHRLPVSEYAARAIKQSVAGYGNAEKAQIQQAVRAILKLSGTPSEDAADGLAVAICHASHLDFPV